MVTMQSCCARRRVVWCLVAIAALMIAAEAVSPAMAVNNAELLAVGDSTTSYEWAELQDSTDLSFSPVDVTETLTSSLSAEKSHSILWEMATVHGVDVAAFIENQEEAQVYADKHIIAVNKRDVVAEESIMVETNSGAESTPTSKASSTTSESRSSKPKQTTTTDSNGKQRTGGSMRLSTAERLKENMHATRFERFTKKNRRTYKSSTAAAEAFLRFKANRAQIVALNDRLPSTHPPLFKSDGPMADMTAQQYRKSRTNARNPRGNTRGRSARIAKRGDGQQAKRQNARATKSSRSSKKPRFRQLKSLDPRSEGAGKAAKYSGTAAKKSGKTGGDAGEAGSKSGKTGGDSGGNGQKSGKTGGDSGGNGQKSGKIGGDSGGDASKSGKTGGGSSDNIGRSGTSTAALVNPQRLLESLRKYSGLAAAELSTEWSALKNANFQMKRTKLANQVGDCGSCYAFAAVDTIVRLVNAIINGDFSGSISPQQAIDCIVGTEYTRGCEGGTPMDVLDYFSRKGATPLSHYPVTGTSGPCRENLAEGRPPSYGWEMLVPPCKDKSGPCLGQIQFEFDVLKWLGARETTPIAYIDASLWQHYSSGIFSETFCSSSVEKGDHIVQIVGFEWTDSQGPAWIIQNTWPNWGEVRGTMRSTIRLPFGVNACGLFNYIINAVDPTGGKFNLATSVVGDPAAERNMSEAQIAQRLKSQGRSFRTMNSIFTSQQQSMDAFVKSYDDQQSKQAKQESQQKIAKDFNIPVQSFSFDELYRLQEQAKAKQARAPGGPAPSGPR